MCGFLNRLVGLPTSNRSVKNTDRELYKNTDRELYKNSDQD